MSNIVEISEVNIDKALNNDKLVVLDFHASWCGPCKSLNPILNEIADYNKDSVLVGKIDVDSNGEVAVSHGVRGIPTIIFFKHGKEVDRFVGLKSQEEFQNKINSYLS
jgi:thioredoxin 1